MSVILTVVFLRETDKAICVRLEDSPDNIWLPKSQVTYDEDAGEGEVIDIELSDWIAKERGLD